MLDQCQSKSVNVLLFLKSLNLKLIDNVTHRNKNLQKNWLFGKRTVTAYVKTIYLSPLSNWFLFSASVFDPQCQTRKVKGSPAMKRHLAMK